MPLRETLPGPFEPVVDQVDVCAFASRWGIVLRLAEGLFRMARGLPFAIQMISGSRSRSNQTGVSETPFELSTHANEREDGCPRLATGADITPSVAPVQAVKLAIGTEAALAGLRWGGGAMTDDLGIPLDPEWRHVDLGPRSVVP